MLSIGCSMESCTENYTLCQLCLACERDKFGTEARAKGKIKPLTVVAKLS